MKITWFAATCFRIQIGGEIVVTDPDAAQDTSVSSEIVSGADRIVRLEDGGRPVFDAASWRPRRPHLAIDGDDAPPLDIYDLAGQGLFIDASGETPLVLACGETGWDRWADGACVILAHPANAMADALTALTAAARPRLVILAVDQIDSDEFAALAEAARGAPVQVLEPGYALEV